MTIEEVRDVEDVRERVERIRSVASDDEMAHVFEDELWEDVLRAIAAGAANPQELAATAIKTKNIDFTRWCA